MKTIVKNKYNTLFIWMLSLGILLISAKAYPVTRVLAERTIQGSRVMIFGDEHIPLGADASCHVSNPPQMNEVLKRWIDQLSHDNPTLFLLELAQDGFVPAIAKGDTIPMLKERSSQCTGNVELRCADYRTTAIKSFTTEFWSPFIYAVSREFEGKWQTFNFNTYKQIMRKSYGNKALKILNRITATQFLEDVAANLKKIELALDSIKDSKQHTILSQYHLKISESYAALQVFFTKYLKNPNTTPYYLAFLNSVSKTHSPTEIMELHKNYMTPIIMNIADAGFFIDVISAVSSGKYARIVTYTGLCHMLELEKNLFEVYNTEAEWLGLNTLSSSKTDDFLHKVGIAKGIIEILEQRCNRQVSMEIKPKDLCLKLGVEWIGVSVPQRATQSDSCKGCGKTTELKQCNGCKKVSYCSSACQKNDWPNHQKKCSPKL
jgi:hypothetical protein